MSNATINNELTINVPQGFEIMSQETLATVYGKADKKSEKWGMHDHEHHVIITVRWENYGSLHLKATNIKNLAQAQQKRAAKFYGKSGYQLIGVEDTTLAGAEAHGYTLGYVVEDTDQVGTILWFKGSGCVYSVSSFRRPNDEEAERITKEVFDSLAFA